MTKNSIPKDTRTLQDKDKQGRERPWHKHKQGSLRLAESYRRLEQSGFIEDGKARRVKLCGGYLEFKECKNPTHPKRLKLGYFCQVRLCPMCSWRRSRMIFAQLMQIIHGAQEEQKLGFITLTLTAKNVDSGAIKEELGRYFKAWDRLSKRKPFKDAVVGWFRALEVKHDMEKDEYHPHFHCLFAVKPSYFRKDQAPKFITQEEWADMWGQAMRLDYTPVVWVEKVKAKRGRKKKNPVDPERAMQKAISEVAKYFSKSEDYIKADDEPGTDLAVLTLDDAIHGRRLVAYGGIFREIRRKLKQQDAEKADLIKLGDEDDDEEEPCTCSVCKSQLQEVTYRWNVGLSQYVADVAE